MLTLTSIFAGLSGVLLAATLARPANDDWRFYVGSSAILFSLYWFVRIAEMLTDALDEGKPGTYVNAMYWFNLAVLSAFGSIAAFVSLLGQGTLFFEWDLPLLTFHNLAAAIVLGAAFWRGPWRPDATFLYRRRRTGVDQQGQLVEIPNDVEWNEWIAPLLARTDS
jgi:hypothetical protein